MKPGISLMTGLGVPAVSTTMCIRKDPMSALIIMQCQADLLHIVFTCTPPGCFTRLLHGW